MSCLLHFGKGEGLESCLHSALMAALRRCSVASFPTGGGSSRGACGAGTGDDFPKAGAQAQPRAE